MKLVYYHPIAIKNTHPFQKVVNPLISLLDRKGTWPDYNYVNMFPMPVLSAHCPDFHATSVARAQSLVQGTEPVTVLWSGGIDSTYVMTIMIELGLLESLYRSGRLRIGLNHDSIRENPVFYEKFILPYYIKTVVQADQILRNPSAFGTIITGEMADNLVGSLTMKSCVDYYNNFNVVHSSYGIAIDWLCSKVPEHEQQELKNFIDQAIAQSPVQLHTSHDLLWYLNFNFKWQAVNFRIVSHCDNPHVGNQLIRQIHHFFNTDEFQQWSMHEGHRFTGQSWRDYKMPMKEQIYRVTHDQEYYNNKTKYPSLPGLLRYRDTYDFIYQEELTGEYVFSKTQL